MSVLSVERNQTGNECSITTDKPKFPDYKTYRSAVKLMPEKLKLTNGNCGLFAIALHWLYGNGTFVAFYGGELSHGGFMHVFYKVSDRYYDGSGVHKLNNIMNQWSEDYTFLDETLNIPEFDLLMYTDGGLEVLARMKKKNAKAENVQWVVDDILKEFIHAISLSSYEPICDSWQLIQQDTVYRKNYTANKLMALKQSSKITHPINGLPVIILDGNKYVVDLKFEELREVYSSIPTSFSDIPGGIKWIHKKLKAANR